MTYMALEPIEYSAIERAEMADPNLRRCLIENCSTSCAVELVHVFSRETPSDVIKAIEWNWGMAKGSLNLDTRQNIFFRTSMDNHRWALLPEKEALGPYHSDTGIRILRRGSVPKIKEGIFKYRLLPIQSMEDIYLTRQSEDSVTIHSYPFEDLPMITSHVNPRYAILHLGQLLCDARIETRKAIKSKIPWLGKLVALYQRWIWFPPSDKEYYFGFDFEDLVDQPGSDYTAADGGDRTPLSRIRTFPISEKDEDVEPWFARDPSTSSRISISSGSYNYELPTNLRKRSMTEDDEDSNERPRKRLLTYEALRIQTSRRDLVSAKWTSGKITVWAQYLSTLSGSPPTSLATSPPAPQPQLLRRSARLLAKRKRG